MKVTKILFLVFILLANHCSYTNDSDDSEKLLCEVFEKLIPLDKFERLLLENVNYSNKYSESPNEIWKKIRHCFVNHFLFTNYIYLVFLKKKVIKYKLDLLNIIIVQATKYFNHKVSIKANSADDNYYPDPIFVHYLEGVFDDFAETISKLKLPWYQKPIILFELFI